jgi:hypothetical protein
MLIISPGAPAHLADHDFSRLNVHQWVLPAPKHLRYILECDGAVLSTALRIFLCVVQQRPLERSPRAAKSNNEVLRIGAFAFIHRFGARLCTRAFSLLCARWYV